jgi:hypothetical protein
MSMTELYMRRTLADKKVSPSDPAGAKSPDIIPYLLGNAANPQIFFKGNYAIDPGKPLLVGESNQIYVRAMNGGTSAASGQVYVYTAPAEMILYPSMWQTNALKTLSGADSAQIDNVAAGEVGVGDEPFLLTPTQLPGCLHYSFVACVSGDGPPDPPPIHGIEDLAAWTVDGNLTSRNVFVVGSTSSSAVQVGYTQGATAATVFFTINGSGCPVNHSWVQVQSETDGAPGLVKVQKTKITDPNPVIGVSVAIPANYRTMITILFSADQPAGEDWQLNWTASMKVSSTHPLYKHAKTAAELGIAETEIDDPKAGPVKAVVLGSATIRQTAIL